MKFPKCKTLLGMNDIIRHKCQKSGNDLIFLTPDMIEAAEKATQEEGDLRLIIMALSDLKTAFAPVLKGNNDGMPEV